MSYPQKRQEAERGDKKNLGCFFFWGGGVINNGGVRSVTANASTLPTVVGMIKMSACCITLVTSQPSLLFQR